MNTNKWSVEKPLFKFLSKEYAEKFFSTGELRIGTLFGFRNEEEHGNHRGDKNEGKKENHEQIDDLLIKDPAQNNTLSGNAKKYITLGENAKNTRFTNVDLIQEINSEDLYIYCMSHTYNEKLFKDFDATVCIRIKQPGKFINAISLVLKKEAEFFELSRCVYQDRRQPYNNPNDYHPAIIKPPTPEYNGQAEVRAIWTPSSPQVSLEPLIIKLQLKHIKRFCEIHNTCK